MPQFGAIVQPVFLMRKPELAVGMLHKFRWIFPSAFILCQAPAMTIFLLR
ncbi:hypothetical protein QUA00_27365 [Microcoleus sp. T2B6]